MPIEDIDYLKQNSEIDNVIFIIDSKSRDYLQYPEPNYYSYTFNTPFKNVVGIDVVDYSVPRTMYSLDKYNNTFSIYIAKTRTDSLALNGLDTNNTNFNIFKKLEIPVGNYTLTNFMPVFNNYLLSKTLEDSINFPEKVEIITYSNPPDLTNMVTLICKNPFILNMGDSSIAETLGFAVNIDKSYDNIKYKYIQAYERKLDFLKIYHSFYNKKLDRYEITAPGIVFFIGEKYITLRCPEIEEHAYGSLAYNNYSLGIAKFQTTSLGITDQRFELQKAPKKVFHPIGKLSKMTFRFETANGQIYDFKGVNHTITYIIYYYSPKIDIKKEFKSLLNPNYKNNFNDYRYTNDEQEESDLEDEDEFSRDDVIEKYKKNEIIYKKMLKDQEREDNLSK